MSQQPESRAHALCPHLAAAVLWMTKSGRIQRGKTKIRYARAMSPAADDLLAL